MPLSRLSQLRARSPAISEESNHVGRRSRHLPSASTHSVSLARAITSTYAMSSDALGIERCELLENNMYNSLSHRVRSRHHRSSAEL